MCTSVSEIFGIKTWVKQMHHNEWLKQLNHSLVALRFAPKSKELLETTGISHRGGALSEQGDLGPVRQPHIWSNMPAYFVKYIYGIVRLPYFMYFRLVIQIAVRQICKIWVEPYLKPYLTLSNGDIWIKYLQRLTLNMLTQL